MAKIKSIKGRQVFDSRGNPTVEAEVFLENNISATAISPSGASTGAFEAHELRDQDKNKFLGKSVNIAVDVACPDMFPYSIAGSGNSMFNVNSFEVAAD